MIDILPGAVLDDSQKRIIFRVQEHTIAEGVTLTVTRGHSTPLEQLKKIEREAKEEDCMFTEFRPGNLHDKTGIWRGGKEVQVYLWQQTWSMLLLRGVVINPPLAAVCLEHYIRPSGQDMYGEIMTASPHIKELDDPEPCPIDWSARVNRNTTIERIDPETVARILLAAKKAGAGIRYVKIEPYNVCVHTDTEKET